ncbi:MAG: hypothetical protein ACRDTE_06105 [Pseudonocardiaceae bacterium]
MIDLDPLWRIVIVLASLGVIPLLQTVGWATRKARDSYTAVLIRSWCNGHRRRRHRRHRQSAPAGPGRAPDAPGPAGRHARRTS